MESPKLILSWFRPCSREIFWYPFACHLDPFLSGRPKHLGKPHSLLLAAALDARSHIPQWNSNPIPRKFKNVSNQDKNREKTEKKWKKSPGKRISSDSYGSHYSGTMRLFCGGQAQQLWSSHSNLVVCPTILTTSCWPHLFRKKFQISSKSSQNPG